jgi:metal-sulfur cluster biosynthetic enzyme
MVIREQIYRNLKKVIDPELNINIVDLGLIYNVKVEKNSVNLLMTLTFPGCPLASVIHKEIREKLKAVKGIGKINIEITFDPPWDFSKVSEEAKEKLGVI